MNIIIGPCLGNIGLCWVNIGHLLAIRWANVKLNIVCHRWANVSLHLQCCAPYLGLTKMTPLNKR